MPTQQLYLPFKELRIELHIQDQIVKGSNTFHTLKDFAEFLHDNPEIKKALQTGNLDSGVIISKDQDMDLENRI